MASKLAEATSAEELMSFHKWMPGGQDAAQALLNADKVSCSWGLFALPWVASGEPCCCPLLPPAPSLTHTTLLACLPPPPPPPPPAAELLLGPAHRAVAPAAPADI